MKQKIVDILGNLFKRRPELETCAADLRAAFDLLAASFAGGGTLLACGNGGSAADSEHIVGELMKGFLLPRPLDAGHLAALERSIPGDWRSFASSLQGTLPAISLTGQPSLSSAFANDVAADMTFAQQVLGYGRQGDVLLGISTSGTSRNVVNAARAAKAFGLRVIGLTGRSGGTLAEIAEVCIRVPAEETFLVQELHESAYHALCAMLEEEFFGSPKTNAPQASPS
ncbi:MAG: SIS domain-containing protein [Rectinemataceae bacterium]